MAATALYTTITSGAHSSHAVRAGANHAGRAAAAGSVKKIVLWLLELTAEYILDMLQTGFKGGGFFRQL